jgi:ABC-type multidrug transport system permease subunit
MAETREGTRVAWSVNITQNVDYYVTWAVSAITTFFLVLCAQSAGQEYVGIVFHSKNFHI